MKVLIADLVVELNPKYDNTINLAKPFLYSGDRHTDITLTLPERFYESIKEQDANDTDIEDAENFAYSSQFCRAAIPYQTMQIHSSALIYNGGAYLFSGDSGVGKSTHTRLWLKAFGNRVHIMNDDKPVVRIYDDKVIAYGTPFDGGSGIALNEAYPLKAIVFLERGESNAVYVPSTKEVIQKLYFQTAHMVGRQTAEHMLDNFGRLIASNVPFYILTCNCDISAAHTAFQAIVKE